VRGCSKLVTDQTSQAGTTQQSQIDSIDMATTEIAHWMTERAWVILIAVEDVIEAIVHEDESVFSGLDKIRNNAKIMVTTGNHLLGADSEFHPVSAELGDILHEVMGIVWIPADVKVSVSVQPNLPRIRVDTIQLAKALIYLIDNALEATKNIDREKELGINAYASLEGDFVRAEIADNGIGIERQDLDRIWIPFFSTKKTNEIAGIGLPTVRRIVRRMHGKISVVSQAGSGTKFVIEFPADPIHCSL
jgi:signal transduction histidine kinase